MKHYDAAERSSILKLNPLIQNVARQLVMENPQSISH